MKHVKSTLAGTQDMNDDLRRYIGNNADNIFDRISKGKE